MHGLETLTRPLPLEILYQDEALVAVNKPIGIMVHHGCHKERVVCADLLQQQIQQKVTAVHRLDRATSGVLLFGLTPESTKALNALFAARETFKRYLALVCGHVEKEGSVAHALSRRISRKKPSLADTCPALTVFRRLQYAEEHDVSLLEVVPFTGRQHQIRRHFKDSHLGQLKGFQQSLVKEKKALYANNKASLAIEAKAKIIEKQIRLAAQRHQKKSPPRKRP